MTNRSETEWMQWDNEMFFYEEYFHSVNYTIKIENLEDIFVILNMFLYGKWLEDEWTQMIQNRKYGTEFLLDTDGFLIIDNSMLSTLESSVRAMFKTCTQGAMEWSRDKMVYEKGHRHSVIGEKFQLYDVTAPVLTVQDVTAPVLTVQDGTAPMLIVQDGTTPMLTVQDGTAPVPTVQDVTAPMLIVQDVTTPVLIVQDVTTPVLIVQDGTTPVLIVQDGTAPMLTVQDVSGIIERKYDQVDDVVVPVTDTNVPVTDINSSIDNVVVPVTDTNVPVTDINSSIDNVIVVNDALIERKEVDRPTVTCKVVLLGDINVGKSSWIERLVKDTFMEFPVVTIGAAIMTHTLVLEDMIVILEIWDTAGQERYNRLSLAPQYYRGANAALVLYDITSQQSFLGAKNWISELRRQENANIVIGLAGNKLDMDSNREVSYHEAETYAEQNGCIFFETSSKTGANILTMCTQIAMKVNIGRKSTSSPDTIHISTSETRDSNRCF